MKPQKEYIADFRQEAEAIIQQQIADYANSRNRDALNTEPSASAPGTHLHILEKELKGRLDQIVNEARAHSENQTLEKELMSFYNDYINDFSERTSR